MGTLAARLNDPSEAAKTPPPLPSHIKRLVLGSLAVTGAMGLLGTALSPYLVVERPLLLVALNPDSRHLVLAAANAELWQVVAIGAPRRALSFLVTYGMGSLYGHHAIRWLGKRKWSKRVAQAITTLYDRLGLWLVIALPLYSVAGLAGLSRMAFWKYAIALIPGQLAFVAGMYVFGESMEAWTGPVLAFLKAHLVESTLVAIGVVILQVLYRRWKRARDAERSGAGDDEASDG